MPESYLIGKKDKDHRTTLYLASVEPELKFVRAWREALRFERYPVAFETAAMINRTMTDGPAYAMRRKERVAERAPKPPDGVGA